MRCAIKSAQDIRRYDFIMDIRRLERVVNHSGLAEVGFVVLLTNDPSYWGSPQRGWENRTDGAFRIHEGRVIKGEMEWSERASEGTKKGREESISLRGSYEFNWRDYLLNFQRREVRKVQVSVGGGAAF